MYTYLQVLVHEIVHNIVRTDLKSKKNLIFEPTKPLINMSCLNYHHLNV